MKHRSPAALLIGLLLIAGIAVADEMKLNLDLPSGNLTTSVDALAKQAGLNMLFDRQLLEGKNAPAVKGNYTSREALEKLLAGSGLEYSFTADNAVAIKTAPVEKVTELPVIEIHETALAKVYVAPNATTATKTDTPILETPMNVQVVTEQVLKDQQATTLTDALNNVAGVVSSRSSQNNGEKIIMRGIANTAGFTVDGGDPGWSNMNLTVDGVRLQSSMGNTQMLNVERVEVLKGPSAVLYGHSEPGGMVNVVTKKPQTTPYYAIQQQIGSWGHSITSVDATGPIANSEKVFYRLIAAYDKSDDWRGANINNKLGLIAPSLLWKINPRTQLGVDLKHDETKANIDPGQMTIWNNGPTITSRAQVLSDPTPLTEKNDSIRLSLDHEFNDAWKVNAKWQKAKQYSFINGMMWGELYSAAAGTASGWMTVVGPWNAGRDWIIYGGDTNNDHLSADVTGKLDVAGLKNTLLIGVEKETTDLTRQRSITYNCSVVDALNPSVQSPTCTPDPITTFGGKYEQFGIYVQDQIELPHNVNATAGARQQRFVSDKGQSTERTETHTTPRLGILWRTQPWLSLYGNYSEGFGQSYGQIFPSSTAPATGAKEYEIGLKTESADGKLQSTLAYFDLTKTKLPMSDAVNGYPFVKPIGEVNSKGVELDVRGEVTRKLSMIFTYAYTDARITKNPDFAVNGCCGKEGDRLSDVPANMASLWADYQIDGNTSQGWKVAGGVNWRDKTYAMFMGSCCSTFTSQQSFTPAYYLVNAMTSYAFKSGKTKWTAQLNINNLLNKQYWSSANVYYNWFGAENAATMSYGAPRSYMASLKAEF